MAVRPALCQALGLPARCADDALSPSRLSQRQQHDAFHSMPLRTTLIFSAACAAALGLALHASLDFDAKDGDRPEAHRPQALHAAMPLKAPGPASRANADPVPSPAGTLTLWTQTMRGLARKSPASLVHRAAVSRTPEDFFAAQIQMRRCLDKGATQALVAQTAPQASEQMKQSIRQLEALCRQRGDRQQLAYVVQSWPVDAPARKAYEALQRRDAAALVDYVRSTGSADFAAQLLPGYITADLLTSRGLLPPLTPEPADRLGLDEHLDLASVSRLRDQFAVSRVVAIWSCRRLGTCVEEAQLDYACHALDLCVDDWRDLPERKVFNRSPVDPNGSPSFFWVSRTRWAQIERAVEQLLADLQ